MTALAERQTTEISTEKLFEDAAIELRRITERADFAIQVVTQAIRTQETVAKGNVLIRLKEAVPDGEWLAFLEREDVGINPPTASKWMRAAQLVIDAGPIYGEDLLLNFGASALADVQSLPLEVKLDVLDQAEETGKPPSYKETRALHADPKVKLSKAQEQLAEAKAKRQAAKERAAEVRANPELSSRDPEYRSAVGAVVDANSSIETLENRIKQLEAELTREKEHKTELSEGLNEAEDSLSQANRKLEQAQKELAAALEEAHSLRFDGETAQTQRISRVGNALMLALPQTLSDVQKYVAEREHFAEKVQQAVDGQVKTLMSYLQEHFEYAQNEEA